MDKRFPDLRSGKTLTLFAWVGTSGIWSCVIVLDCMVCPLGQLTWRIGVGVSLTFDFRMMYVPDTLESGCAMILDWGWATSFVDVVDNGFIIELTTASLYDRDCCARQTFQQPVLSPPNFLSKIAWQ